MNKLYLDVGTSKIKILYNNESEVITNKIEKYKLNEYLFNLTNQRKIDFIYATGSGIHKIKTDKELIILDELKCNGYLAKYLKLDKALVVNIGTGTSFVEYDNGNVNHKIGTGIGGGTLLGLSKRLLNSDNIEYIEKEAMEGDLSKINIQIRDIYNEKISWLKEDITVSNFAKDGFKSQDVSFGIHSLVIEPIMSIAKAAYKEGYTVIFSGGVVNNECIRNLIKMYSEFFEIQYTIFNKSSYGTCYGMYEYSKIIWHNVKKNL